MNLSAKIATLRGNRGLTFTDFGTRRRFSKGWQDYVVKTLRNEFADRIAEPQFRGTSNVHLAMKYGLLPMGTSAHEMYMIMAGISDQTDDGIRNSHNKFLDLWWDQYGYGLSIALTDTFGSEFFFKDMTSWQAAKWKGLRHDSGDPIVFGERVIEFYKSHGIDPIDKIIVFSDGLDVDSIININNHFKDRIKVTFGWGTNLTNDLGFKALSLVIKPVMANNVSLVKLSDNLAKAMGDVSVVERYKRIFGHTNATSTECRY
jgi:nicotinate phosphoribosyltransferase